MRALVLPGFGSFSCMRSPHAGQPGASRGVPKSRRRPRRLPPWKWQSTAGGAMEVSAASETWKRSIPGCLLSGAACGGGATDVGRASSFSQAQTRLCS